MDKIDVRAWARRGWAGLPSDTYDNIDFEFEFEFNRADAQRTANPLD